LEVLIFEEVTFRLGSGDRVGLVGKTVEEIDVLKILAKNFAPDSEVLRRKRSENGIFASGYRF
jgi:ATP-binding cassette subfamily F protein 3